MHYIAYFRHMKRLILLTTLLFTVTLAHSQTAEEWVEKGVDKSKAGNKLGAISDFDRALKLKPDYALAHYNRGLVNAEIEENGEALNDFNNCIKYDSTLINAYHGRGYIYAAMGKFSEAISDLSYFLKSAPDDNATRMSLAILLFQNKEYQRALTTIDEFLNRDKLNIDAILLRGDIKLAMRDSIAAINDYDRCINLKADFYDAYLRRGNIYLDQKKYTDAIEDYNTYLLSVETSSTAFAKRAEAKLALKDTTGALDDYTNALKYTRDAHLSFDRGLIYLQLGELEKAVNDFTNAIEQEMDEVDLAYFNRGIAYFRLNSIKACDDWHEAGKLGLKEAVDNLAKYCQ